MIVLISTMYDRLSLIKPEQFPQSDKITYIVSCQGFKNKCNDFYVEKLNLIFGNKNRYYLFSSGLGLSKSRNLALKCAFENYGNESYYYICDDDVYIHSEGLFKAENICREKKLDLLCGKISHFNNDNFKKNYANEKRKINIYNASSISSVEMIISSKVIKSGVFFKEDLGLGTLYPSGEEYVFIADIIKCKLKTLYFPIFLCSHPPVTSGQDFYTSENKIMAKGMMLYYIFGCASFFYALAFSIKKYPKYKSHITFRYFFSKINKGILIAKRDGV